MKALFQSIVILAILALFSVGPATAPACTGITIRPKDGSIIFARTLEFGMDLKSNILIVPRGKEFVGTAPGDKPGLRWKTKFGIAGTNAFDLPVIVDGLNEKGLQVGLFYFPGFADYQAVKAEDFAKALAPWELGSFLLGTCSDVKEAVAAAKSVRVGAVVQKDMGFVPPVHYIVTDATGSSVVLEYIGGELKVHANPLGVMSNSPSFDWHMTNLSNYVTMTSKNIEKIDLAGKEIKGLGQGSGMLGLPGDFTPPSRFVRAVAFSKSALPVEKAKDGILQAFHILNQFDIPKGAARGVEQAKEASDYTLWTSAADLKNMRYYFRTFDNSRIRMVDLKAVDLDAKEIRTILMKGEEQIEDVSGKGQIALWNPGSERRMAFDETLARRIRQALARKKNIDEKKMFGGVCFLLNGNMLVGVWKDALIARLGPDQGSDALLEPHVKAFDITGKPMKNWILVEPKGVEDDDQLKAWIRRAVKFVGKLPAK